MLGLALQHPTGLSHSCFCVDRRWKAVSESIITKASNKDKNPTNEVLKPELFIRKTVALSVFYKGIHGPVGTKSQEDNKQAT